MNASGNERVHSFCGIHAGRLVYVGPRTRDEFDSVPIEERVGQWTPDKATTLIKGDGTAWERRCHSKEMEGSHGMTVIFQWWDERVIGSDA